MTTPQTSVIIGASGELIAFWLADGVVIAGMNANVSDVAEPIQQLIRARVAVDPERLADPDTPVNSLTDFVRPAVGSAPPFSLG